ncbi:HalX domain-containing protein [Haloarcula sp. S1CR25-12]|uniref:HalX domain-containing protein n=1 Tax=Haloarcula saliterrae TaxID=2950534 RepID=A0ABU2FBF7_9EURY|nr:HalX domain-containing protein [Haloarcula sp. S1CR25-12]MDS0259607.1 HalX domain-containing protein [Haloarcula sp. S1CR25-12]
MTERGGTQILVVDDDVDVAETYASHLGGQYAVETVYSGEAALEALSPAVDIVLLDRRMPKLSGGEVLAAVRERGLETRVAMVTGEKADFDIIDMPFDDYVQKPVTPAALLGTVRHLERCLNYEEQMQEYYALTAKRAALVESKTPGELEASEQFSDLEADIEAAEAALSELVSGFEPTDFDRAFRDIDRPEPPAAD